MSNDREICKAAADERLWLSCLADGCPNEVHDFVMRFGPERVVEYMDVADAAEALLSWWGPQPSNADPPYVAKLRASLARLKSRNSEARDNS